MLATKRVPECDRIPSLQRNVQPLKQELCLTWFLCNPCYSSAQLRDKFQCRLVSCSTRIDCDGHEVVRFSQICVFCCFVCCRSVSRCCRSRRRFTYVRVSKCVWYGNVSRQWLASRPWDLRCTIWPFAIRPRQIHWFLDCWVLCLLHQSPDDIVHLGVSDLPRRAFPVRQAV